MAEWYRQNSELYLFAISAYNLEYKRIRSNMKVLRLARGATLDYGAGNGEILLELARRGHRATYYDVEGVTMRFARQRAANQGLAIEFFTPKTLWHNTPAETALIPFFPSTFWSICPTFPVN